MKTIIYCLIAPLLTIISAHYLPPASLLLAIFRDIGVACVIGSIIDLICWLYSKIIYKEVFGKIFAIGGDHGDITIMLANNKPITIYGTSLYIPVSTDRRFIFCTIKYNILRLRWEQKGICICVSDSDFNEKKINGYFGD